MDDKYEVQMVESSKDGMSYRVTEIKTDSRIATCYLLENAYLVANALNAYALVTSKLAKTFRDDQPRSELK